MANDHTKLEQIAGGLRCAAVSDVGMRRASNQDSMAVALADSTAQWQRHGHLLVVADGMGAHAAGELASQLATDTIPHYYQKQSADSPSDAIFAAVREANRVIHDKGQDTVDFHGMGTTCSCLVLLPAGALVAHVGDSRVYRLRGDRLEQLTFDHSLVWEMAAAGHATEEDVPAYVPKNVITRSLGPHPTVAIDIEGPFAFEAGDRFLLCSDGLTGPLKPELVGMVLASLSPDEAAQTLVDLANLLGGPDNITVVVAEVVDPAKLGEADLPEANGRRSVGARMARSGGPLAWWMIAAASGLIGAMSVGSGNLLPAALCGACSIAAVVVAVRKTPNRGHSTGAGQAIGVHGKAPYRYHDCVPGPAGIETLSDVVRQLEDIESHREWDFDWQEIHNDRQQAHAAIATGDYQSAVISYSSAVRRLMQALRERGPKSASDSSIKLS